MDLCGGTGVTAQAILDLAPAHARVISLDNAAAMQRLGQRTLSDSRLSWATASAEDLAGHASAHQVDAVVCNSAIWKTNVSAVFAAVHRALRPGGRFVFNIGGGFAGPTRSGEQVERAGSSLDSLIRHIAARDYGYTPPPVNGGSSKLPLATVTRHLADAELTLVDTEVIAQQITVAERKAWLPIPVFARPTGDFTYEQKTEILEKFYAQVDPHQKIVTSRLIVVAQAPSS